MPEGWHICGFRAAPGSGSHCWRIPTNSTELFWEQQVKTVQNKDPRQRRARLKRSTSYFCLFSLDENELQCKPSSKEVKTFISLPQSSSHFAAILAKSLLRRHVTCTTLVQLPVRVASPVPSCVYGSPELQNSVKTVNQ